MDQRYLNEYLASVQGDLSLTIDSKALIVKHITGLFAFAQSRQANESNPNPVNKSGNPAEQKFNPNYPNQTNQPNQDQTLNRPEFNPQHPTPNAYAGSPGSTTLPSGKVVDARIDPLNRS